MRELRSSIQCSEIYLVVRNILLLLWVCAILHNQGERIMEKEDFTRLINSLQLISTALNNIEIKLEGIIITLEKINKTGDKIANSV